MSFTNVDLGFTSDRYSFDGLGFGPIDVDEAASDVGLSRVERCATCGLDQENSYCVACADFEFIQSVRITTARELVFVVPDHELMTDAMGRGDGDVPDSIGGEDRDVPDSIGGEDDQDERQDDDTD